MDSKRRGTHRGHERLDAQKLRQVDVRGRTESNPVDAKTLAQKIPKTPRPLSMSRVFAAGRVFRARVQARNTRLTPRRTKRDGDRDQRVRRRVHQDSVGPRPSRVQPASR